MARPRTFDEQDVLASARSVLWANGINATPVIDLTEATGLSTSSLYGAFGSKQGLALATLDDYLSRALEQLAAAFAAAPSPVAAIEQWLEASAAMAADPGPTRGCYSVVCATELAATDPDVADRLRRHDVALRALLEEQLTAARAAGEITGDPRAGALLLATTVNGAQVEARKGISLDDARRTLMLALDALR